MSQIIPFESKSLPAHITARAKGRANTDLTSHVGNGGFPVMSIKGKTFAIMKDKERKVLEREVDGEMVPAQAIDVVILKANPHLSKVFYIKGYEDGNAAAKPDCFSNDSLKPDSTVEKPQCKTCAACPKNVWGSGKEGKGKACGDSRRIAIAAPDQLNEPMLLRVPPASLKPLAEYGKKLDNRGTSYDAVVTKLKFERDEATPKLIFLPVAFLSEEQIDQVDEMAKSEKVLQIVGLADAPVEETAAASDEEEEAFEQLAKTAPAKKAAPAVEEEEEAPAPVAKKKAVVEDDELEAAVAPAKKAAPVEEEPAPAPKKAAKVVEASDLDSELDNLLGELDD